MIKTENFHRDVRYIAPELMPERWYEEKIEYESIIKEKQRKYKSLVDFCKDFHPDLIYLWEENMNEVE